MAGNVTEWVNDWWQEDYYSVSPGSNPQGPATGSYKVQRGGSFYRVDLYIRVADRVLGEPDRSGNLGGFRCAADIGR